VTFAQYVRRVPSEGESRLYRLSEPRDGVRHVVVSAIGHFGRSETLVLPATEEGKVMSWDELAALGAWDHEGALRRAGLEVL